MADDSGQSPTRNNNLRHGIYRYRDRDELPADLTGLDVEIASELLAAVGGEEKYRPICTLAARRAVFVQLGWNQIVKQIKAKPDELPAALKVIGSYMEGLRRDLSELQLTPASAGRKDAPESVSAKEILDSLTKSKENEPNDKVD